MKKLALFKTPCLQGVGKIPLVVNKSPVWHHLLLVLDKESAAWPSPFSWPLSYGAPTLPLSHAHATRWGLQCALLLTFSWIETHEKWGVFGMSKVYLINMLPSLLSVLPGKGQNRKELVWGYVSGSLKSASRAEAKGISTPPTLNSWSILFKSKYLFMLSWALCRLWRRSSWEIWRRYS